MAALARRYAKATVELAEAQGKLEAIGEELRSLAQAWASSPELRRVAMDPRFTREQRVAIAKALAERMQLSDLTRKLLLVMAGGQRLELLPELANVYAQLVEERGGSVRVELAVAADMDEAYYGEVKRILEQVLDRKVALVSRRDDSLIGGVVAKVGSRVFDASLRTRLTRLRERMMQ